MQESQVLFYLHYVTQVLSSCMAFDYSPETLRVNYLKIRHAIKESENNIIFGFLDIKQYPLEWTEACSNQILLVSKSGRFELLPRGVNGGAIREYVGIAYSRITKWTILPTPTSKDHPSRYIQMSGLAGKQRDIYECD
jgi:hypothetical protein